MLVTDVKRVINKGRKDEKEIIGFSLDGYLVENLEGIPDYLGQDWDCVGIISGHGKVGPGKSTLAGQVCTYLDWLIAGGRMNWYWGKSSSTGKKIRVVKGMTKAKRKIRFNLKENVAFSAEDLQEKALKLYEKYGKNQVLLYDEGKQGLDSARAMESINKGMEDFFQDCRYMGHVIIIVLPNFFKLHEDYAVTRSLFLIDVFVDKDYRRGYFHFYNEIQKEWLFFLGKKKIGVTQKYSAAHPSFSGNFTPWLPFNKDEYEEAKNTALDKKRKRRRERNLFLQRDFLVWRLRTHHKEVFDELEDEFDRVVDIRIGKRTLQRCCERINEVIAKKKGL